MSTTLAAFSEVRRAARWRPFTPVDRLARPVDSHFSQNSPIMAGAKRKREFENENSEMHHQFQHQKVVTELKRRRLDGLQAGHSRKVKAMNISFLLMFKLDVAKICHHNFENHRLQKLFFKNFVKSQRVRGVLVYEIIQFRVLCVDLVPKSPQKKNRKEDRVATAQEFGCSLFQIRKTTRISI